MQVKDLIEQLNAFDPEMEVAVFSQVSNGNALYQCNYDSFIRIKDCNEAPGKVGIYTGGEATDIH